jgi:hypothetical protein
VRRLPVQEIGLAGVARSQPIPIVLVHWPLESYALRESRLLNGK